jgi:hypothetical protein
MQFRADEYFRASIERIRQARILYKAGESYALTMYCSGLAVECLLRAFRWRKDPSFEGRHDLKELVKSSGILRIDDEQMQRKERPSNGTDDYQQITLRTALTDVTKLWHNNLRFASEASLRAFLRSVDRLRGVKGDALKKNASDLLEAAQFVIIRGEVLWISFKR